MIAEIDGNKLKLTADTDEEYGIIFKWLCDHDYSKVCNCIVLEDMQ